MFASSFQLLQFLFAVGVSSQGNFSTIPSAMRSGICGALSNLTNVTGKGSSIGAGPKQAAGTVANVVFNVMGNHYGSSRTQVNNGTVAGNMANGQMKRCEGSANGVEDVGAAGAVCCTSDDGATCCAASAVSAMSTSTKVGNCPSGKVQHSLGAAPRRLVATKASRGYAILLWVTKLALIKWGCQSYCQIAPAKVDQKFIEKLASHRLQSFMPDAIPGKMFTSTITSSMKAKDTSACIPFPAQAKFCSRLGHSHRVDDIFHYASFAQARESNLELIWAAIKQDHHMKKMMDLHQVCESVVQDALCFDAFPLCHHEDESPCITSCRNIMVCFKETYTPDAPDFSNLELLSAVDVCQKLCSLAAGVDKTFDISVVAHHFLSPATSTAIFPVSQAWEVQNEKLAFPAIKASYAACAVCIAMFFVFAAFSFIMVRRPFHAAVSAQAEMRGEMDCQADGVE